MKQIVIITLLLLSPHFVFSQTSFKMSPCSLPGHYNKKMAEANRNKDAVLAIILSGKTSSYASDCKPLEYVEKFHEFKNLTTIYFRLFEKIENVPETILAFPRLKMLDFWEAPMEVNNNVDLFLKIDSLKTFNFILTDEVTFDKSMIHLFNKLTNVSVRILTQKRGISYCENELKALYGALEKTQSIKNVRVNVPTLPARYLEGLKKLQHIESITFEGQFVNEKLDSLKAIYPNLKLNGNGRDKPEITEEDKKAKVKKEAEAYRKARAARRKRLAAEQGRKQSQPQKSSQGNSGQSVGSLFGKNIPDRKPITTKAIVSGFGDRSFTSSQSPDFHHDFEGKVNIKVCVNAAGEVTSTIYTLKGSTTSNSVLTLRAGKQAKKYRFEKSESENQCGLITFDFRKK